MNLASVGAIDELLMMFLYRLNDKGLEINFKGWGWVMLGAIWFGWVSGSIETKANLSFN